MSIAFEGINVALLDSTFFFHTFSPEVKAFLQTTCVYASNTFDQELVQFRRVLPADQAAIYARNIDFITKHLVVNSLCLSTAGEDAEDLHEDLWSLILLLTRQGMQNYVVLTANELLIQRIILKKMPVSVYNLRTGELIQADSDSAWASVQPRFSNTLGDETDFQTSFKGSVGKQLYRKNGSLVTLGEEIRPGMDGTMFRVAGQPDLVAKIFGDNQLSSEKLRHFQQISSMEKPDVDWVLFPIDLLYYDQTCTDPAGFTERFARTSINLDNVKLYLSNFNLVEEEWLEKDLAYTVDLCLKIVRQVCYLNCYGFYISDFNLANLAIISDQASHIQMFDTDSFGYKDYFSATHDGYVKSREYDTSQRVEAIHFCSDALYVLIFCLLTLGDAPMSEFKAGVFKYDNPQYFLSYRRNLVPENIWALFAAVFHREKEPSSEALLHELSVTQAELAKHSSMNQTYRQLLNGCVDKPAKMQTNKDQDNENNNVTNDDERSQTGFAYEVTGAGDQDYDTENEQPEGKKKKSVAAYVVAFMLLFALLAVLPDAYPYLRDWFAGDIAQSDDSADMMIGVLGSNTIDIAVGKTVRVMFTAPDDGLYEFTTIGTGDTYGGLYSSVSGEKALAEDDNGGADQNFRLERNLSANETIYVAVRCHDAGESAATILNISKMDVFNTVDIVGMGNNTLYIPAGITIRVKFTAPEDGLYVFATGLSVDDGMLFVLPTGNALTVDNGAITEYNCRVERNMAANETVYIGMMHFDQNRYLTLAITKE